MGAECFSFKAKAFFTRVITCNYPKYGLADSTPLYYIPILNQSFNYSGVGLNKILPCFPCTSWTAGAFSAYTLTIENITPLWDGAAAFLGRPLTPLKGTLLHCPPTCLPASLPVFLPACLPACPTASAALALIGTSHRSSCSHVAWRRDKYSVSST